MARRALAFLVLLAGLLVPLRESVADGPPPLPPPRRVPAGPLPAAPAGPVPADPPPGPAAPRRADTTPGPAPSPSRTVAAPIDSRALPGRRALPPLPEEPVDLFVDPRVGRLTPFPVDETTLAVVMTGNPRITSGKFWVKARTVVVWIDRSKAPSLAGFGAAEPRADEKPPPPAPPPAPPRRSVVPEAVLGLYAEGAIEIATGGFTFRAEEAYIDVRTDRAVLIQPRFETSIAVSNVDQPVPLFVRAQRARIVAAGRGVFERAEATTSRSNDRIALEVRTLAIDDLGNAGPDEPLFLGFRTQNLEDAGKTFGSQRYSGAGITAKAERIPIFYWPSASFGGFGGREFPVSIRRVTAGNRSSFGYWGFVGIGGEIGAGDDPPIDWMVDVGGYTKRGPALRGDVKWHDRGLSGRFQPFLVNDRTGDDRDDYEAEEGLRYRLALENRFDATPALRFDVEVNELSDRGVNREFFESDSKNHKDRETYARVRWMRGGFAATGTYGAHLREFATETVREPEVALWSESLPLFALSPGVGVDLSTEASSGRLRRRFDEDLPDEDYAAWRSDVSTRLYVPFDVGDVRVSPYAGVHWTAYTDRDDGGDDLSRTALEAGVRVNLQLHRDFGRVGGWFALDGLRHVVDLDAGAWGRFLDDTDPDEVPFFDRLDEVEDRTQIDLSVRNRVETRRVVDGRRQNATLADVLLRVSLWPEEKGPYLQRGTGEAEIRWMAEVIPERAWLRGESVTSLDGPAILHASAGVEWSPSYDLRVGAGMRFVRRETLAPWYEAYWRYSPKWAVRSSALFDLERSASRRFRLSILRFSDDHFFELGVTLRDGWDDLSVTFNFLPAIGGVPVSAPFDPRDDLDYTP